MSYRPDLEDEWQQHEPPGRRRDTRILWLGAIVVVLFLLGICLLGGYFLVRQFQARTEATTPLIVPTSPVSTPTIASSLSPTSLPLVPTATLRRTEPPPTPPTEGSVQAVLLSVPPIIDGDLAEWEGREPTESRFRVFAAASWDGTDDVSALWRLGWDEVHLYLAVSVTDDAHAQNQRGNQIFRGDSVDMQVDTDRVGDFGDGLSPDDFQFVLSPGDFADLRPSAFRFQGTTSGRILDAPGGHSVRLAAVPTALGYNLEAAIPWSDLNVAPFAGLVLGLALNVNDNDAPGTSVQEVMKSHVPRRTLTNPTTWGTLTLK